MKQDLDDNTAITAPKTSPAPQMEGQELTGQRYWRSLDELAETPEFNEWLHREFPAGASELEGVNRRQFMKMMAASFGLAGMGMAGCRRPKYTILPYGQQPENLIPGVPNFYSTSLPGAHENLPLVVETHQARPTKVEGNPSYQPAGGKTEQFAQASVLDLYDPDRLKRSEENGARIEPAALNDRLAEVARTLRANGGKGVAFLAEPSTSVSRAALVRELQEQYPDAVWAEYEPIQRSTPLRALGSLVSEGARIRPHYQFEKAQRVLAVDADFLGKDTGGVEYTRAFTKTRKIDAPEEADQMSRLYSVESDFTLTGAMADHRLRLNASFMPAFLARLLAKLYEREGKDTELVNFLKDKAASLPADTQWIDACADDLLSRKGEALVVAGEHLPEEAQVLAAAINTVLEAPGNTLRYLRLPDATAASLGDLANRIRAGEVQHLIILGGNPVYDAPADLAFKSLIGQVENVIRLGSHEDETAKEANLRIAASHYLESWGDGRALDGTLVPVQPMIEPLYETRTELDVLARCIGRAETEPYAIVRANVIPLLGAAAGEETNAFNAFLGEGVHSGAAYPEQSLKAGEAEARRAAGSMSLPQGVFSLDNLECRFVGSPQVGDGRYSNNGWLMECPEPMTKLTWDNAILISPRLATQLEEKSGVGIIPESGVINDESWGKFSIKKNKAKFNRGKEQAPLAKLTLNGSTITAPIHVMPGLPSHTVVLPLGWGRMEAGRIGKGAGFNFYPLRSSTGHAVATGGKLAIFDEPYPLANTQEHWSMEGRAIIREASLETFKAKPKFAEKMGMESHSPPIYGKPKKEEEKSVAYRALNQPRGSSLYKTPAFNEPDPNVEIWQSEEAREQFIPPQQWGMTIDLNSCTGCNACVIACQSENNIPIVGKDQVLRGREMHWIRLDRYFSAGSDEDAGEGSSGIPEDPQVAFQGVACMHCELAPCETVCPVNATVHDKQGLNVMAYNRCVGTRYCANNCPYKVRRFNFFDWNKRDINRLYEGPLGPVDVPETEKMYANPDVTVRMRGVMEKCTYCVQRIESAKIKYKARAGASSDYKVPDGAFQVACQQACPAECIDFGDISDKESKVYKQKNNPRDYSVLGYLNTRPRTSFLARLRNPNPKMPAAYAYAEPYHRQDYDEKYGHGHDDHGAGHNGNHGDAGADKKGAAHAETNGYHG